MNDIPDDETLSELGRASLTDLAHEHGVETAAASAAVIRRELAAVRDGKAADTTPPTRDEFTKLQKRVSDIENAINRRLR